MPAENVTALAGGETVLGMRVAYTPGHASHHVCYLHEESGTAFVGDVAACKIPPTDLVVPPTPPPDIDIELWEESIGIVESWEPAAPRPDPLGPGRRARPSTWQPSAPACAKRPTWPARWTRRPTRPTCSAGSEASVAPEIVAEVLQAVPSAYQWSGLDRYWRKKAEREAA